MGKRNTELDVLVTVKDYGALGYFRAHQPVDALGLGFGDDGGKRLLDPYRVGLVLGVGAPNQDISYPIDTKSSGTLGRSDWEAVDWGGRLPGVEGPHPQPHQGLRRARKRADCPAGSSGCGWLTCPVFCSHIVLATMMGKVLNPVPPSATNFLAAIQTHPSNNQ